MNRKIWFRDVQRYRWITGYSQKGAIWEVLYEKVHNKAILKNEKELRFFNDNLLHKMTNHWKKSIFDQVKQKQVLTITIITDTTVRFAWDKKEESWMIYADNILDLLPTHGTEIMPWIEQVRASTAQDQMVTRCQDTVAKPIQANGALRVLVGHVRCRGRENAGLLCAWCNRNLYHASASFPCNCRISQEQSPEHVILFKNRIQVTFLY